MTEHSSDSSFERKRAAAVGEPSRAVSPLVRRMAIGSGAIATKGAQETPSSSAAVQSFATAIGDGLHAGPIQRRASGGGVGADAGGLLETASRSSDSALPTAVKRKFEASLGADLSTVRVHHGDSSAQASTAIAARAYTVGQDIHFNAGQYDPGSACGEHLLAHEVAHTVQQGSGSSGPQTKLEVSSPGDACELEADRAADAMTSGRSFSVGGSSGVHRSIMRTGEDDAAPAVSAPPVTAPPVAGATGDGAAPDALPMVGTTWTINYDLRGDAAGGHEARGRTEADALHVRSFTITPDNHPVSPREPFSGYSLRGEGPVEMGTRQHPRGEAGTASASIAYLNAGEVRIRAVADDPRMLAAHDGRSAIASRVRSALLHDPAAALVPDSGSCTAALSPEEQADGIRIEATSREGASRTVSPTPLRYPAIQQDGQAMHVMVHVPTGERTVIVDSSSSDDHVDTAGTSGSHTGADSVESELTAEVRSRIVSELAGITPSLGITLGLSATATLEEELVVEHRSTTESSPGGYATAVAGMQDVADDGIRIIAPPMWALVEQL